MSEKASIGTALATLPVGVALGVGVHLIKAWTISLYWAWFAVPAGAPVLGYWTIVPLLLLLALLTWRQDEEASAEAKREAAKSPWVYVISRHFGYAAGWLAAAGAGWFWHWALAS